MRYLVCLLGTITASCKWTDKGPFVPFQCYDVPRECGEKKILSLRRGPPGTSLDKVIVDFSDIEP